MLGIVTGMMATGAMLAPVQLSNELHGYMSASGVGAYVLFHGVEVKQHPQC